MISIWTQEKQRKYTWKDAEWALRSTRDNAQTIKYVLFCSDLECGDPAYKGGPDTKDQMILGLVK